MNPSDHVDDTALLASPFTIGRTHFKNRMVFPPLVNGFADRHRVSPRTVDWYARLAAGGVGAIITEGLSVHPGGAPADSMITTYHPANRPAWRQLVDAVEGANCRLIGQLMHLGRSHLLTGRDDGGIAPSAVADPHSGRVPRPMTRNDIAEVVDAFAEAAAALADAGFSGVEIHAAHGHLLSLFLSPLWNTREDAYGGDDHGRTRIIREAVTAVRAACPTGFLVGLSLQADEAVPHGLTPTDAIPLFRTLVASTPVDLVTYRAGTIGPSLPDHIPDLTRPPGTLLAMQRRMRAAAPDIPSLAVGRLRDPGEAANALRTGAGDLVALGRALVVDPELPRRAFSGREPLAPRCAYCNVCWTEVQAGRRGRCPVNDSWGRPTRRAGPPAKPGRRTAPRRVTVVGTGAAGLAAAAAFAEYGDTVTMLGNGGPLGGRLAAQASLPALCELDAVVTALEKRVVGRVELRRGHRRADAATIRATEPELIVLATGSEPSPIPDRLRPPPTSRGRTPEIITPREWGRDRLEAPCGARHGRGVTVVLDEGDGDATPYALARLLASLGETTVLLTADAAPLQGLPWINRRGVQRLIQGTGVGHALGVTALGWDALTPGRLLVGGSTGYRTVNGVTRLIWSGPRVARLHEVSTERLDCPVLRFGDRAGPTTLSEVLRRAPLLPWS
ncbi:hypothetical protein ACFWIA_12815 [Streptomyces sp. NPDC127068]|uniref:oxidoreductase n=1 Tax=Streptomyces sp. NPDC127068 TaxID=3347127 RepID=UPI003663462A